MRSSNQILHVDQTRRNENSQGRPQIGAPALAKIIVTQVLKRDVFTVADLLVDVFHVALS